MAAPHPSDPTWRDRGRLSTIRVRLTLGLLVPFISLMGVSALQGFWPGGSASRAPAFAVLVLAAIVLPAFMAAQAREIVRHATAMDAERAELIELYNRARLDALVDGLTGLGNHRAFQDELARQLDGAARDSTPLALLLIDVDDLKTVNDQRGHGAGDDVLVALGRIAARTLRRTDRAFRLGGDEFAVVLPTSDIETGMSVARRILAAALEGGDPGSSFEPFSLSIGVAALPTPTTEPRLLYRNADAALNWCKQHGRTAAVAYDAEHHGPGDEGRSAAELTAGIEAILASRALRPVFQPIFSMSTGRPIGYEGLVRPTDDSVFSNAGSLFAAAEVAERIVELDFLALETVAAGIGTLEPGVYVSVNLSPRSLESQMFRPGELKAIFHRNQVPLDQVVLELTEREAVADLEQLRRNVDACRRAGMRIAADDVGAGNAGLRLLSEISFDIVKIDLSLVQGGLNDSSHAVLVAIQEIAARWKASVVAEGVETSDQLAVIRAMGITAGQGYLLGRPSSTRAAEGLDLDAL
ncbi:MAG TPA: EAL domain-containing protein, partial [Candidatus Deferrimicrobium sp.]|nr:EAL domain-containing protein [Candidatus Deferrimicrobium sp.]